MSQFLELKRIKKETAIYLNSKGFKQFIQVGGGEQTQNATSRRILPISSPL